MTPRLPSYDRADAGLRHAKLPRNVALVYAASSPKFSDPKNILDQQLGARRYLPARLPPLGHRIGAVICVCPQPKVSWLDARGGVAYVTDEHLARIAPVIPPRNAVRVPKPPPSDAHLPISPVIERSRKQQAPSINADASPDNPLPRPSHLRRCQGGATLQVLIHVAPIIGGWGLHRKCGGGPFFVLAALKDPKP
jgi:hypothetical protein